MAFLDNNGLLYLWGKIKAIVPTKTSQITNDSGFITIDQVPEGAAASTTTPKANGTASVGSESAFARGDHIHPHDTTKVDKVAGKGLSTNDLTDALKANYDAAYTHSQSNHAPTDAEKNIIVGVKKNGTALTPDANRNVNITVPTKTSDLTNDSGFITVDEVPETYTLPEATGTTLGGVKVGTNVDVSGGTISVKNGSTSAKGVVQLNDAVNSTSTTQAATANAVKKAYDLASGKQSPATSLGGYGITDAYTKTEIDNKLSSALTYKGTKATYADLPTSGNKIGDVWNVTSADTAHNVKAGDNVVWNGTGWDVLSGVTDLSGCVMKTDTITNAEIDTIVAG